MRTIGTLFFLLAGSLLGSQAVAQDTTPTRASATHSASLPSAGSEVMVPAPRPPLFGGYPGFSVIWPGGIWPRIGLPSLIIVYDDGRVVLIYPKGTYVMEDGTIVVVYAPFVARPDTPNASGTVTGVAQ